MEGHRAHGAVPGGVGKKRVVAEILPQILRAHYKSCPDEDDFTEMFVNLGDYEAQSRIRLEHPKGSHCELLMQSAHACEGCPKNPYKDMDPTVALQNQELRAWALTLGDYAAAGILPDISQLTPREAHTVRLALAAREEALRESQAALIASKMGELLSAMFGGKKDG